MLRRNSVNKKYSNCGKLSHLGRISKSRKIISSSKRLPSIFRLKNSLSTISLSVLRSKSIRESPADTFTLVQIAILQRSGIYPRNFMRMIRRRFGCAQCHRADSSTAAFTAQREMHQCVWWTEGHLYVWSRISHLRGSDRACMRDRELLNGWPFAT